MLLKVNFTNKNFYFHKSPFITEKSYIFQDKGRDTRYITVTFQKKKRRVKRMKNVTKNAAVKISEKAKYAILSAATVFYMAPVHATNEGAFEFDQVTINEGVTIDTVLSSVLGIMFAMATYIGIALFAWGIIMLFLAIKNEDPESKSKAIMTAVAGAALFSITGILSAAGIISVGG